MNKILVAGSINMDTIIKVEKFPSKGVAPVAKSTQYVPGGKSLNQAIAAHRLGAKVSFLGKVGKDDQGQEILRFMRTEKLDLTAVEVGTRPTSRAEVMVDKEGNNKIKYTPGSNEEVTATYVTKFAKLVYENEIVVVTLEIPVAGATELLSMAKKQNKLTILNAAPAIPVKNSLWKQVDFLVVNEKELAFYSDQKKLSERISDILKVAKLLQQKGPKVVVATLGSKGVVSVSLSEEIVIPGIKVKAVDTTGAGDCFVGAFAVQIYKGKSLKEALTFANKAASLSVQSWGASVSMPYLKDLS